MPQSLKDQEVMFAVLVKMSIQFRLFLEVT